MKILPPCVQVLSGNFMLLFGEDSKDMNQISLHTCKSIVFYCLLAFSWSLLNSLLNSVTQPASHRQPAGWSAIQSAGQVPSTVRLSISFLECGFFLIGEVGSASGVGMALRTTHSTKIFGRSFRKSSPLFQLARSIEFRGCLKKLWCFVDGGVIHETELCDWIGRAPWLSPFYNQYIPHKWIVLFARSDWLARRWLAKYYSSPPSSRREIKMASRCASVSKRKLFQ